MNGSIKESRSPLGDGTIIFGGLIGKRADTHGGCFTMALAFGLQGAGFTPTELVDTVRSRKRVTRPSDEASFKTNVVVDL